MMCVIFKQHPLRPKDEVFFAIDLPEDTVQFDEQKYKDNYVIRIEDPNGKVLWPKPN